MARSLSLSAYLAYARRNTAAVQNSYPGRPEGRLIWGHAADRGHVDALLQLHERLAVQRHGLSLLLTAKEGIAEESHARHPSVIFQVLPEESVAAAEGFLSHWKPDICIWTGGDLQPAILTCADRHGIPLCLVDAEEDMLSRPAWRWFPDLPRWLLRRFEFIMARDAGTARFLRRMGVRDTDISVTGPFLAGTVSLPYNQSDRDELASILRGRPIWLAAMLKTGEIDTVLSAHREVSKLSHRVLLIMVPEDPDEREVFAEALSENGIRYIQWSEGALPEETTQVILADTRGEMGLWYRIAPISFLGSSLVAGAHGCDPNEPAAHGSAILYGPNIRKYLHSYSRFAEAGAARIVKDADTLAAAVKRLIPPDRSAAMAHAAWDVASRGAELTDRIADVIHDTLDALEAK